MFVRLLASQFPHFGVDESVSVTERTKKPELGVKTASTQNNMLGLISSHETLHRHRRTRLASSAAATSFVDDNFVDWFSDIPALLREVLAETFIKPSDGALAKATEENSLLELVNNFIELEESLPAAFRPVAKQASSAQTNAAAFTVTPLAAYRSALALDETQPGATGLFLSQVAPLVDLYGQQSKRAFVCDLFDTFAQTSSLMQAASGFLRSLAVDAEGKAVDSLVDFSPYFNPSAVAGYKPAGGEEDQRAVLADELSHLSAMLIQKAEQLLFYSSPLSPSEDTHVRSDIVEVALLKQEALPSDDPRWKFASDIGSASDRTPVNLKALGIRYLAYRQRGVAFSEAQPAVTHLSVLYMPVELTDKEYKFKQLTPEVAAMLSDGWEIVRVSTADSIAGSSSVVAAAVGADGVAPAVVLDSPVTGGDTVGGLLDLQFPLGENGMEVAVKVWGKPVRPVLLVKREPASRPLQRLAVAKGFNSFSKGSGYQRLFDGSFAPSVLPLNPGARNPATDSLILLTQRDLSLSLQPVVYTRQAVKGGTGSVFPLPEPLDADFAHDLPRTVQDIWQSVDQQCPFSVVFGSSKQKIGLDKGGTLLANLPVFRSGVYVVDWNPDSEECSSAFVDTQALWNNFLNPQPQQKPQPKQE